MKIIKIQPTEKNPIVIDNYPYGFKKTKIRYWVESIKKKGDRFCSQTLNPKTNSWNNPKKSTYGAVNVVYEDDEGHITYFNLYWSTSKEDYQKFMDFKGDLVLNELQEEQLKRIRAYIGAYEGVEFNCVLMNDKTEEEKKEFEEKQEENQKIINKRIAYNYNKDKGILN